MSPIGVIGIGGLGVYAVQFAKALGHSVVAIDNRPQGRELAAKATLPADLIIDYNDPRAADQVKVPAGRNGLAAVLVTTDDVEGCRDLGLALNLLRPRRVRVPIGLPVEGFQSSAFTLIFSEPVIRGSVVAKRPQVEDMMKIVAKYAIRNRMTTFTLDEASGVMERYLAKDLKGRLVSKLE